ncbi:hypothetical protein [Cumulibacter manganitolerans]|uniref:hypothetical protein n=1 Tax=Cumulibacter manganitolerans TaxID=1884992 RepID=UPI001297C4B3|nr:hypothetical protein [Cumulibacter manganitolerans]
MFGKKDDPRDEPSRDVAADAERDPAPTSEPGPFYDRPSEGVDGVRLGDDDATRVHPAPGGLDRPSTDPYQVRHDGSGPTHYGAEAAGGYDGDRPGRYADDAHPHVDEPTRTFTPVRDDGPHDRYDARPEERFITGEGIDRDADGVPDRVEEPGVVKRGFHISKVGGWLLGLTRILLGWQFLWAFVDKTFGLGFSTTSERAWINGGKPTKGFLGGVLDDPKNPFHPLFQYFADQSWTDWLFMIGLAGIGIVLILGLGKVLTWIAAISGVVMLALMYLASWPAGHGAGTGTKNVATNPFLDDHLLNAVLLLALAACNAGAYLGLAKAWRTRRAYKD